MYNNKKYGTYYMIRNKTRFYPAEAVYTITLIIYQIQCPHLVIASTGPAHQVSAGIRQEEQSKIPLYSQSEIVS